VTEVPDFAGGKGPGADRPSIAEGPSGRRRLEGQLRPAVERRARGPREQEGPPSPKGYGIDVYGTLAYLDEAAQAGKLGAELIGGETEPAVTRPSSETSTSAT